ncbi:MAG: radical SAM protein [Deltaproteobacteria bacterium]|nr:radical SAM protein [Deltaproteobacteria bacterium]
MRPRARNRFRNTATMVAHGGPAICNIAVTNRCNARCDFCSYAVDKKRVRQGQLMGYDDYRHAIDILHGRGVRYITLSGGEPFLHPRLYDMVAYAVGIGIRPSVCTNGSRLGPEAVEALRKSGLKTLIVSMDASSEEAHEKNRGLPGVCGRIRESTRLLNQLSIECVASVTISRLVDDYDRLASFLEDLGFRTVTFSYPKRSIGSSSLVFSDTSSLLHRTPAELAGAFHDILRLKSRFRVLNPSESLKDMLRLQRGERQVFPCFGGYKYFFLDWNLDVWRCDMWPSKMGSIHDFEHVPFIRDHCTMCMSDCYRDSSVLLNFVVSLADGLTLLKRGKPVKALETVFTRSALRSVKALLEEWGTLRNLSKTP